MVALACLRDACGRAERFVRLGRQYLLLVGSLSVLGGCANEVPVSYVPGVSIELAEVRADTIANVHYDLSFSIPSNRLEPVLGTAVVSFVLTRAGNVVFDFAQSAEHVLSVRVNGDEADYVVENEHIVIAGVPAGQANVEVEFVCGDESLNRQADFMYTLFVPDRARFAFPVFDQPDIKARYALELEFPSDWRAVANGPRLSREMEGERVTVRFGETAFISSYLFSFAVGRFEVVEHERDGQTLALYHRETDQERVQRNMQDIFSLHHDALAWMEDYTGIPYPFEKFEFVAMPSFQYGGMEHPGSILYRAEALFLDPTATQNMQLGRASLIAHETAHQWFGDLVTMKWFNDVWMKETFANFFAAKIVNPAFPDIDHDLRFLLAHYPAAYGVDRTAGSNPIRQPLANLNEAGTLYGAIIYEKAPIVVRQLERLIGAEALRDGLREYLGTYAYGNADWKDLVTILARHSGDDLVEWSRVWVEESGRPRIRSMLETEEGLVTQLYLEQEDPTGNGRFWNQRFDVYLGYEVGRSDTASAHLRNSRVEVPGVRGRPVPDYVLVNGDGVAYGSMGLDDRSKSFLLESLEDIEQPLLRAVSWLSLWDAVLEGELPPTRFLELVERALPIESVEQNVSLVLGYLETTYWKYLSASGRERVAAELEEMLWQQVVASDSVSERSVYFRAYRGIATTEGAVERLHAVWQGNNVVPGLTLTERDLTTLALELAVRGVDGVEDILRTQLEGIENGDRRSEFEFIMDAVSAVPSDRDEFFSQLTDASNRERETWVLRGLQYLNHPIWAQQAERYLPESLELLEEIQRTGDIFFPERWLGSILSGHQTASAAAIVQDYLATHPELPGRLRLKVLQAADSLFRAQRVVN